MNKRHETEEYFLYNSLTEETELFNSLIYRFFGKKGDLVLAELRKLPKSKNADFYKIFAKYVHKKHEDIPLLMGAKSYRQIKFIEKIKPMLPDKITSYLDYGCSNGVFTSAIANYYGLSPKNVYCIDIIDKPPLIEKLGYNYIKINAKNSGKIIDTIEAVDFITILNVIHHIPYSARGETFDLIKKKSKKNTLVLIKEHDCGFANFNKKYKSFITEWHKLYEVLYDESDSMGVSKLVSFSHIKAYMTAYGFILKDFSYEKIDDDILRSYFALFSKI